jgi:hypothetical protein
MQITSLQKRQLDKQLEVATKSLAEDNLGQARLYCSAMLASRSDYPPALHIAGLILAREGKFLEGAHLVRNALLGGDLQLSAFSNYISLLQAAQTDLTDVLPFLVERYYLIEAESQIRSGVVLWLMRHLHDNGRPLPQLDLAAVKTVYLPIVLMEVKRGELTLALDIARFGLEKGWLEEFVLPLYELLKKERSFYFAKKLFRELISQDLRYPDVSYKLAIISSHDVF